MTSAGNAPTKPYGDGAAATSAQLSLAQSVSVDPSGDVYISDIGHNAIRKVTRATGVITTWLEAPGAASCTGALQLYNLAADASDVLWIGTSGNAYISGTICGTETGNTQVFGIVLRTPPPLSGPVQGILTRVAGVSGGSTSDNIQATATSFAHMSGIALTPNGSIAVATGASNTVRLIDMPSGNIHTIAGNGTGVASTTANDYVLATTSPLYWPYKISYTPTGHLIIPPYYDYCFREVW